MGIRIQRQSSHMNKRFSYIIGFSILILSAIVGMSVGTVATNIESTNPLALLPLSPAAVSPTPSPRPEVPLTLSIPSIGVNTSIEHVGLDKEKRMDVPKDPDNVAWYNLGPRPGEQGNAVIAGHLDSTTGPAVFYKLDQLKEGDELFVTASDQKQYRFVVTGKSAYPENEFPLQEVFGPSDIPRLNLITCKGTFNKAIKSYSHRTVIYTQLAE